MGHDAVSTGSGSVALGSGSVATEDNVVSVGREGAERRIINVADGVNNHDVANMGQLRHVESKLTDNINKVGAGAAAMANLHPLEYEHDDKLSVSAAVGNYKSETAMAVGAFFRPDAKTMFSVSGSFGSGDNMIGAGVSKKFGKASEIEQMSEEQLKDKIEVLNESNEALKESNESLRSEVSELSKKNSVLESAYNALMAKVDGLMAKIGFSDTTGK